MHFFMFSYTGVNYFQIITVHIIKGKHHLRRRKSLWKNSGAIQAKMRIATSQKMVQNKPDLWLADKVTLDKIMYLSNVTGRGIS